MTRTHRIPTEIAAAVAIAGLCAGALLSSPALATSAPAQAVVAEDWSRAILSERIDAVDRYAEAVEISNRVVRAPATAPVVYLASGEGYADALSGAAIAAQRSAPLLLTRSASLPTFVADEFNRLSPRNIVILGGEASVKPEVVSRLQALLPTATITRIGGADRYAVSRNLVSDPTFGAKPSTELLVASGRVFPDALGAAPAAASHDAPVLLVDGTEKQFTPDELALIHSRGVRSITLLGGANTTSTSLEHSLDNDASSPSVRRIGGANRYDVASNVATAYFLDEAPNTAETVYLATGADFPDALAGAVIAKANNAPIFLTMRDCIPSATADVIDKLQSTHVVILGGKNSVSAAVETLAVCSP